MTNDDDRASENDGCRLHPNAGRSTPGQQQRVMTEEEALDIASNDSNASDPPSMIQPTAGHDLADRHDNHANKDSRIWELQGSLTIAREPIAVDIDLAPLADDYEQTRPLRLILCGYLEAPEIGAIE